MKRFARFIPLFLFTSAFGLASCKKDSAAELPATGLAGRWQLISHQCYCAPAPLPNEVIEFSGNNFLFFENNRLGAAGPYTDNATATICGTKAPAAALSFAPTTGVWQRGTPVFTLSGNTLRLDYGGPCDAPVDTYERMP